MPSRESMCCACLCLSACVLERGAQRSWDFALSEVSPMLTQVGLGQNQKASVHLDKLQNCGMNTATLFSKRAAKDFIFTIKNKKKPFPQALLTASAVCDLNN